jgi:hypothetical protein
MFQSVVNVELNVGVPGELCLDEPSRVEPVTLAVAGAFGFFFTKSNSTQLASPGGALTPGSIVYGGIAILPKSQPLFGSSAFEPLNPNLSIAADSQVAMLTFGSCKVAIPNAWEIGDFVQYNLATGALATFSPSGAVTEGFAQIPGAVMTRFGNPNAGGGVGFARFNAPN